MDHATRVKAMIENVVGDNVGEFCRDAVGTENTIDALGDEPYLSKGHGLRDADPLS
jgi:hypothetical protein